MHITEPLPGDRRARLAFGLDWRAYPVKGGRAERRRYADDFGATHYVEYRVGEELIGGFATPDTGDVQGARLYSGAARIALHARVKSKIAALVLLQDGEKVHLVFVVRGAVRHDEVLTLEAANTRRFDIEQECLRLNLALTTLGAGQSIGDVDEAFNAAALLAERKCGRIEKLPMHVPAAVPLIVIVATLVFGVSKVMDAFAPPPPPPKREPTLQERYAKVVTQTFAHPEPRASALAPMLLTQFGPAETVLKGWLFDRAECGAVGHCVITFRREGGNFDDFNLAAPASMRPLRFDADARHLSAQGPAVPAVATVSAKDVKDWPSEQALIDMVQTPPQRLSVKPYEIDSYGYSVKLDPAKPLLAAPPALARAAKGKPIPMIRQGTWKAEGFRWQAPLLARLPASMTLESLTVELWLKDQVGIHFTAKGKYYVPD
ncbi:type 4b pilus protein PilO2 [Paraburkholderia rhizosphaerae]|uniref:Pilin accessory protein (PilO) n=1 Tax=Paraburkholderia rhizosphaerae TaxID=480658 RepID=A0A4R8LPM4_9BURK|nr:type 4b pilus protein PilO2 [Paraburkholderia rhizosphaerae]TDY48268.1 pilin accessory protein (PilO) [Paraburkholderia rhizosphaerae]